MHKYQSYQITLILKHLNFFHFSPEKLPASRRTSKAKNRSQTFGFKWFQANSTITQADPLVTLYFFENMNHNVNGIVISCIDKSNHNYTTRIQWTTHVF